MRVLINGGGVAGLTLAYWLRRNGIEPVVLERSPHGRLGEYGIDFLGTAHDVAGRMGIVDRLEAQQLPVDSVDFVDASGRAWARLTVPLLDRVIKGPRLGLMQNTLEEALLEAVRDDVEIRFGESIEGVRIVRGGVEADLASGGTEKFDLLVGADGSHSLTRELVFGAEERFARYLGCRLASYKVPDRYHLGRVRAHYTEPGRQTVVYPTGRADELAALFVFRARYGGAVPRQERLDLLRSAFDGMGWITPALLEDAPADGDVFMDTVTQIVLPSWHRGRVVLVGDACGSLTMLSAQGVSMAMGGAYLLAEALRDEREPERAFDRYERRMRGEVARRQRTARLFTRTLIPATRPRLLVQRTVTRTITRAAFAPVLRRRFGTGTILAKRAAPPTGWRRRAWRLPIGLFRAGLGRLVPHRMMLLTHTGRNSGQPRQAVIEIVARDRGSVVAASGFGTGADWYRNVLKTPEVTIQIGGHPRPAVAVPLSAAEGADVMATYAARHPAAARRLCDLMGFDDVLDFRQVGGRIPFVRFSAPR
ncbi:nitroreductase family deazaflavin-dependent oxidoreductase [Nonomuraea endophytica]|uniref:Deazaflavin-dependent oxidoreductase (Nitroreductase family) n=1 Tax=Nonomuraea endophytica TaxID=714136 RepID=A0A7W8AE03_9ACTN|nr:nitroreductase family deazaflavin-dependent oxidoreductase [Nonomuraea endophytica]MBB5084557.1 deazaflavin-dependent oxidoreductase (nitroreductase family) [Nonomuraea endophytica]